MKKKERTAQAQLALMLLTRLPAGQIEGDPPPLGQAAWAFPLVGVLIGAISGGVFLCAEVMGLPDLASAFLAIGAAVLLTGGLHEDGLADMADGFGGGRTRERKLEIMRDSRLGSYGALALVLVVGLIASCMAATGSFAFFVVIGALSRTAMLLPLMLLPTARNDGLGASAATSVNASFWAALGTAAVLALLLGAIWPAILSVLASVGVMALAHRQVGGQTGDVLGATQKLSEAAAWLAAAGCCAI